MTRSSPLQLPRVRGLRFGTKIVLLLVLLVLTAQAVTFAVMRYATERSVREQLQRELDVGERVWNRFLEARNRQLLDRVAVLARDFGFRDAVTSRDAPTMTSALANAGGRIGADAALLLDPQGAVLVSLLPDDSAMAPDTLRLLLERASTQGDVGGVVSVQGQPYQLALVPVFAPALVGWVGVLVEFGLADVREFAALTRLDASVLVGTGGSAQLRASTLPDDRGRDALGALTLDAGPGATDVRLPGDDAQPSARALQVALDPQQPVHVLLQASRVEAEAPFADLGRQVLALSALAALVALAVAVLAGRRVSRPVAELASATARIQRGEYAGQAAVAGTDELAQLADAFNRMQAAIAEREATIRHQAGHDRLTGLPNRERALQMLAEAASDASTHGTAGALLTLDLEHFQQINDTLGHAFGDTVLVEIARRLRDAVRPGDTVARLGADEFLLLLTGIDAEGARQRAEGLLQALRQPLQLGETPIRLDASIGIAVFPEPGCDAQGALRRADIALHEARQAHGGIAMYASGREEQHLRQLRLIGDLRHCVERDELELHYQPQIDLVSGAVAQAEALLRWQHPQLGRIGPDEFIPLAERSGLIHEITLHVIDCAVEQVARWRGQGLEIGVAVNLSAEDLANADLPLRVHECLRRHAVAPARLLLEVTESAVMRELELAVRTLHEFRRMGIAIAIDDFGTGHSSLAQLKRLPVDELKIDKGFVQPLAPGSDDELIVRAIIDLAHTLSLRVVAEGVENAVGLEILRRHGCETAQGYWFSRPLPADELLRWTQARRAPAAAVGDDRVPAAH